MNLDNDHYNRDIIVVNNDEVPSAFALNEVRQGQQRAFTQMIISYGTEIFQKLYF